MNKEPILINVIMPTLNSGKTIRKSLDSLRMQKLQGCRLEILIIDGGSTDETLDLAKEYGCTVLPNPRVMPECAKHEAIMHGKGKYAIFLDSDEVLNDEYAVQRRLRLMQADEKVKIVLTGGYQKPPGANWVNDYQNNFSDPFSFFMYGTSSLYPYYYGVMTRRYEVVSIHDEGAIIRFNKNDVLPLVDISAGAMIDLEYLRTEYADKVQSIDIVPLAFCLLESKTHRCGVLKHDFVYHYSADTFKKYLKKLKSRVVMNTYQLSSVGVGFIIRDQYQSKWFVYKKYLFIPFALTLVGPLLVSLWYATMRRSPILLLHMPLTFYVAVLILFNQAKKAIGLPPTLRSWGG
jgi:glycosyltransferase involved in cell wall biosynthesis